MKLRHSSTILSPSPDKNVELLSSRISALAWAPNGSKLAACKADKIIILFDEHGNQRDQFSAKPADKTKVGEFSVVAMSFSPESTKLALAQTDGVIFVYKLGYEWGQKKSIVNKIVDQSPITSLLWPNSKSNELFFGLFSGKVRTGNLKTNKASTLYDSSSYVCSIAVSADGNGIISSHVDGTLNSFFLGDSRHQKFGNHNAISFAACWGKSVAVAGDDSCVYFYSEQGDLEMKFDYSAEPRHRDFFTAAANSAGDVVVIGDFDCFFIFSFDRVSEQWKEAGIKEVKNMYSVTSISWKYDGSELAIGTAAGIIDRYTASIKKSRRRGMYDVVYVSQSQILLKHVETGSSTNLQSELGIEIFHLRIVQDRYATARTNESIIVADLTSSKVSEVQWFDTDRKERFIFEYSNVVLIALAGEISIVEYGQNDVLGTVRTDLISTHLISVQIDDPIDSSNRAHRRKEQRKTIAYTLDNQTISIKNLVLSSEKAIDHSSRIDWLELNARSTLLVFRDKKGQLHLFDIEKETQTTLLGQCGYTQWVPRTDVLVAQSQSALCIWYNIRATDQVTNHEIAGNIYGIVRTDGRTELMVMEGNREVVYNLDEPLIEFGSAVEDGDFVRAIEILEPLELSPESKAMWSQLNSISMQHHDIETVKRCAAALGDVARIAYLEKLEEYLKQSVDGTKEAHWLVKFKFFLLNNDLSSAQNILLSLGRTESVIEMYEKFNMYEEALSFASTRRLSQSVITDMTKRYLEILICSDQVARAGTLVETTGNYDRSIELYLKAQAPHKALQVLRKHGKSMPNLQMWMESVAQSFESIDLVGSAGECYESLHQFERALNAYIKGKCFRQAVDLARKDFPEKVKQLEENWGDSLCINNEFDMAINHFIEAGANKKAIEAAIRARQWMRASQLCTAMESENAYPYLIKLAENFEKSGDYLNAERHFLRADEAVRAVDMYANQNEWAEMHRLAQTCMKKSQIKKLFHEKAMEMRQKGDEKEAEKIYLEIEDIQSAAKMYEDSKNFDNLIRLVKQQRPDLLKETYRRVAEHYVNCNDTSNAEKYLILADDPSSAVDMYISRNAFDEALKISTSSLGGSMNGKIGFSWYSKFGEDADAGFLKSNRLVEKSVQYAVAIGKFLFALRLCKLCDDLSIVSKVKEQCGTFLESEGQHSEAERNFIEAAKPTLAVDMYLKLRDWENAVRVAQKEDPASISKVFCAQAEDCWPKGSTISAAFADAEELFVKAGKPERALQMYRDERMFDHAMRICEKYLPHRKKELKKYIDECRILIGNGGDKNSYMKAAKSKVKSGEHAEAIDLLMNANVDSQGDSNATRRDSIELWSKAIEIAKAKVPDRYVQTVRTVSERLRTVGEHELAADVLRDVLRIDEAIEVLLQSNLWTKAREFAHGSSRLKELVENAYEKYLSEGGTPTGEVAAPKQTIAMLSAMANEKRWDELFLALSKSPSISNGTRLEFTFKCVEDILQAARKDQARADSVNVASVRVAIRAIQSCDPTDGRNSLNLMGEFVKLVLSMNDAGESKLEKIEPHYMDILHSFIACANGYVGGSDAQFQKVILCLQYYRTVKKCVAHSSRESLMLASRVSMSLLKYGDVIPLDKCFYLAGTIFREIGDSHVGFKLLNRYVDLVEAIDDCSVESLDTSEFSRIPSILRLTDETLPKFHFVVNEEKREEIRDWVLSVCVNSGAEEALPSESEAQGTAFETFYPSSRPICAVAGYPVRGDRVEVGGVLCNRNDYQTYVKIFDQCPVSGKAPLQNQ